jgi:flagellar basal body-associated protein FliL
LKRKENGMNPKDKTNFKKEVKKKMSGWLIALIVVAVLVLGGVIFAKPISKACNAAGNSQTAPQSTIEIKK